MRVNLLYSADFFLPTLQITRDHALLVLRGMDIVLPIKITFKHIDLAILKLTLSCVKNIVVWNAYAIKTAC